MNTFATTEQIVSSEVLPDGNTKIVYNNNEEYIGSVSSTGQFDGFGLYKFNIGNNYYKGEFKDGQKHGICEQEMYWGLTFEGFYENNLRVGMGKETYRDGEWSKGNYVNNKRSGVFTFINNSGDQYTRAYYNGELINNGSSSSSSLSFCEKDGVRLRSFL